MPSARAHTDQKATNRVRRTIAEHALLPPEVTVEAAIAAVMCTLTERLTAGEAHELVDALPRTLRPMFVACALHRQGRPTMKWDRAEFLARVAGHLDVTPAHAEIVCEAVFEAVRSELPERLIEAITAQLPHGLKGLWLAVPPASPIPETVLSEDEARRVIEDATREAAPLPPGVDAADAFAAVMCALSQRLSGGEARDVLLGLPNTLRPLLDRCILHRSEPGAVFGRAELVRRIGEHAHIGPAAAEAIASAVFGAVKRVLPEKAVLDVASQLPGDILDLWERS